MCTTMVGRGTGWTLILDYARVKYESFVVTGCNYKTLLGVKYVLSRCYKAITSLVIGGYYPINGMVNRSWHGMGHGF